ncbi:MAG: Rossmann-fold NAD(P)-binding domain-containing protein [Thermoplasmataceae archaeon]
MKRNGSIGIVGLGSVGKALRHVLSFYHKCYGYDIDGRGNWEGILRSAVILVCVNTPEGKNKRLDCSNVDNVLERLSVSNYSGVVAIKSTVRVGYMEFAVKKFPDLKLVYFPEFLREKSTLQWTVNPDRLVLAGNPEDISKVLSYFDWVENARNIIVSYREAELGKLAHNAFIATKVTFANEMERISLDHGADPEKVLEIVWSDRRVGSSEHLRPYLGAYGGKCVPKDAGELETAGDSDLLRIISSINDTFARSSKNDYRCVRPQVESDIQ